MWSNISSTDCQAASGSPTPGCGMFDGGAMAYNSSLPNSIVNALVARYTAAMRVASGSIGEGGLEVEMGVIP